MSTVRLRRLAADFDKLKNYARRHPRIAIVEADGDPPEKYQFEFRIRSLRQVGDDVQEVKQHLVEITLPRNYPRTPPHCRMLSPVFHPNIAPHAICVGDHWSPGESLESIVIRIGEMLAYQTYNVKSPLNGEAARWVEQNQHRLPIDGVSLLVEEESDSKAKPAEKPTEKPTAKPPRPRAAPAAAASTNDSAAARPAKPSSDPPATPERISVACPSCGTKYKVAAESRGRSVRCKACEKSFVIS